jgi:hypothetical protein
MRSINDYIFETKILFKINTSSTIKNTTIIYHYEISDARTD